MLIGIFGAGRNGSTLLMRLLDGSPGLWIYPIELNYLRAFAPRTAKGEVKNLLARYASALPTQISQSIKTRQRQQAQDWSTQQLQELKSTYLDKLVQPISQRGDPRSAITSRLTDNITDNLEQYLDAVRSFYDLRPLPATPLLMFKSIEASDVSRYAHMFPGMKFIHIVRHPYSNYSSLKRTDMVLKQKPFWFQGGDILRLQLESRWIPHAHYILQGLEKDPGRHYLVRYEDLCESPAGTVAGICSWLGVAPPEEPTIQTVLGGKHLKILPSNPSLKGVDTPAQVVSDMAKEYGYDDILTERERKLILVRTYQLGRRMGYFNSEDEVGLRDRLALFGQWLAPDQWEYMNASSRFRLMRALVQRRLYIFGKLLFPML